MRVDMFFDTSILIYMVAEGDPRATVAESLLIEGGVISVQVLNEFANVAKRKYAMTWPEIESVLADIRLVCAPVVPVTIEIHEAGLRIAHRYGYRIYDSLLIASALEGGCTTLYSEDMQDGQQIGGVTIRNPFINV